MNVVPEVSTRIFTTDLSRLSAERTLDLLVSRTTTDSSATVATYQSSCQRLIRPYHDLAWKRARNCGSASPFDGCARRPEYPRRPSPLPSGYTRARSTATKAASSNPPSASRTDWLSLSG